MKIGFIGAGKVGKALGLYFKRYHLEVSGFFSRTLTSAYEAAGLTGSTPYETIKALADSSDVIFITAPDLSLEAIDAESAELGRSGMISEKLCWIHVSGALSSECLARLKALGYPVGSMHPLQSFGNPCESSKRLDQALFSIEGTESAVTIIRCILEKTGGRFSRISSAQKPLYHAGACVISNYLVTLLESGSRYFEAAGINRKDVFDAVMPLIDTTLSNIREKGTVDALTGPIVRGDYNTLQLHLQALEYSLPSELELYKEMALKTIEMISEKRIKLEQQQKLMDVLEGKQELVY